MRDERTIKLLYLSGKLCISTPLKKMNGLSVAQ